ncbi:hypothetical protein Noda2021_07230 [Candidatus Dependentiae bacterium Noda2021]|nr:hypothetical protein Noda2021_07230 [Candidatus Dependentiae bacterium Noda2021]
MKRILYFSLAFALCVHAKENETSSELIECTEELNNIFSEIGNHIPGIVRPTIKAVKYALIDDQYTVLPSSLVENALFDAMQTIDSTHVDFANKVEQCWHSVNDVNRKHNKRKVIDNLLVQQSVKVNNLAVGGTIFGTFAGINQVTGCGSLTAATGATGLTGFTGNAGSQILAQGATGDTGATGATGTTGFTGFTGPIGALGPIGDTGFTGPTGDTGFTGPVGPQGARGALGLTGNTGFTGNTGATGGAGQIGSIGNSGSTGSTGTTGFTGFTGLTGLIGFTGIQGSTGNTGPSGVVQAFALGVIETSQSLTYQQEFPFTLLSSLNITLVGTSFTFSNPGVYEVTYSVNGFESGGSSSDQVQVYAIDTAGVTIESSIYGLGRPTAGNTVGQMLTGQFIIQVSAGDTLRLVNSTGTIGSTLLLSTVSVTPPGTIASIYIRQIA